MSILRTAVAIAAAGLVAAAPARAESVCKPGADARVQDLAWLVGDWIETSPKRTTRERWSGPYGGALLGVGATVQGDTLRTFEFFRIALTAKGVSYFASPGGAPATEFAAVELCADRIVFENPDHDFPQRIRYAAAPDGTLVARIEGTLNGKLASEEWRYRREE